MGGETIAWSGDSRKSILGRIAMYTPYGLFGGAGLLIVLSTLSAVLDGGDAETLAVAVVFALVGGPLSLAYLWLMARYRRDLTEWLGQPYVTRRITTGGIALSIVVGATLLVGPFLVAPIAALVLVVLGAVIGRWLTTSLETDGELERDARRVTLTNEHRIGGPVTLDLDDATAYHRIRLGAFAAFVLRRAHGRPAVLTAPSDVAPALEEALERGVRSPPVSEPRTAGTTRPMRIALAAIGVGHLAFAVALAASGMERGRPIVYPALTVALLGAFELSYAIRETQLARRSGEGERDG